MRNERIGELFRERPADEPPYAGRLAPTPMPVLATRPHVRGREARRAVNLGVLLSAVVGVGVIGLVVSSLGARSQPSSPSSVGSSDAASMRPNAGGSPQLGVIPWLDARPSPAPTPDPTPDPGEFPSCTNDELVLVAGGWGGATGSVAGGASVINLASNPCTVGGKPEVDLLDGSGRVIAHGVSATAPSHDELIVLETGGEAGVLTVWTNWCGEPPARPLQVFLTLPREGGTLSTEIRDDSSGSVPRCDSPGAGSSFGVPLMFAAPEPSSGG
jgi:hypothetical protein